MSHTYFGSCSQSKGQLTSIKSQKYVRKPLRRPSYYVVTGHPTTFSVSMSGKTQDMYIYICIVLSANDMYVYSQYLNCTRFLLMYLMPFIVSAPPSLLIYSYYAFISSQGSAWKVDPKSPEAKLMVRFWVPPFLPLIPVNGDYWVMDVDKEGYTYALVGQPSRKFLWVSSRLWVRENMPSFFKIMTIFLPLGLRFRDNFISF